MGSKEYSSRRRIGCSVCSDKNTTLIDDNSSNKLKLKTKNLGNNVTTNLKYNKCNKGEVISTLKPQVNECYCNNMEHIKKESSSKLICSKRFNTPNIDIDEDWLNEMLEFRRENWFDCHSNSTIFKNPIDNINVHTLNFDHSPLTHNGKNVSPCMYMDSSTIRAKKKKN